MHTDLAGELFGIVGRFRRQLRRSTRQGFDRNGLTQSQVELLRLVPPAAAKDMRSAGKYTHWRIVIGADGTWHSFRRGP